jgi:hypothetical protein
MYSEANALCIVRLMFFMKIDCVVLVVVMTKVGIFRCRNSRILH